MDLIISGKDVDSEDEEDDENEKNNNSDEENEDKKKKKNKKKKKSKKNKKKQKSDDEDDDEDEDEKDDEFIEVEETKVKNQELIDTNVTTNNTNINNTNTNLFDFTSSEVPVKSQQVPIQNNIFNVNGNINIHNNTFQSSQPIPQQASSNGNLLDVFHIETEEDTKAKNLVNSIQQAYNNPNPIQTNQSSQMNTCNSARGYYMNNSLYSQNNLFNQPNYMNPSPMNNGMYNMYNTNTMNMGTQGYNNGMYPGMSNQYNTNYNTNNYQQKPINSQFNMDLYNQNRQPQTQRGPSTSNYHLNSNYDFNLNNLGTKSNNTSKPSDPFSNLVTFK